jgi:coenzyme F420 hydrogenase subunit beta
MALQRTAPETSGESVPIDRIVESGLCIGCGLCQSIAGPDRLRVEMTAQGRLRPAVLRELDSATLARIGAVCPGLRIAGAEIERLPADIDHDPIWGPATSMVVAHAGDPEIRFRAAAGGVLSALSDLLLRSGQVEFVLHVAASRQQPMRSERQVSFDRAQVLEGAGSRYGPVAPLIDFLQVLDRGQPFAFVGKPCDISAIRNLAKHDARVDRWMKYALTLICGGESELGKSQDVLDGFGLSEDALRLFRYRGYGNPGPTRVETRDGRAFDLSYRDMWADESGWRIQSRCKICPDAIGEAADLVVGDCWPGCDPVGEDEGFNSIMVRTRAGSELYGAAIAAGAVIVDRPLGFRDFDYFQPHQVRLKKALWARLAAMRVAGLAAPAVARLRVKKIARGNTVAENLAEGRGTLQRIKAGRVGECAVNSAGPAKPRGDAIEGQHQRG